MNESFRKISALFLALYFMGISIGFSMDTHYCMGKIADVEFFGNKASCSHHNNSSNSNHCHINNKNSTKQHCSLQPNGCCYNKSLSVKITSKTVVSEQILKIENPSTTSVDLLVITSKKIDQDNDKTHNNKEVVVGYSPPPFIIFQQLLFYH
jgi:hypothetical protein